MPNFDPKTVLLVNCQSGLASLDIWTQNHTKPRDWLVERLRNDLFCVEWDVKPQLNESINPLHFKVNLATNRTQ